ncbi:MAG: GNAT family N-acetyltransferase [Cytophagales bacterium]|nr:MAG: GNAT family N-acetyltransferase [Cytophagales bacterium]
MIELLTWDSDFFGYKVGKVIDFSTDIEEIISFAKKENYRLLYAFISENNDFLAKKYTTNKGVLVDEKITFLQNIPTIKIENDLTSTYESEIIDEKLLKIGLQSGIYSRFNVDKNFKNKEFERLYRIWIKNSVQKLIAEKVIIQKIDNNIVGLLTLGIKNNKADIGILAVDENFRGRKIGKNLVLRVFEESKKIGQKQIQVVTQKANENACNFYQKMGFEIEKTEKIYHFWI